SLQPGTTEIGRRQTQLLDTRAHRAVIDQDASLQLVQIPVSGHVLPRNDKIPAAMSVRGSLRASRTRVTTPGTLGFCFGQPSSDSPGGSNLPQIHPPIRIIG